jgi:hypothetical protein
VAWLVGLSLATACASPYTPSPDRPFEAITEFRSSAHVALVNAQPDDEPHKTNRILANYKEWTDVAIQIAERELVERGVTIDPAATRVLRLAITDAETTVGFVKIRTEIRMDVETGAGQRSTYTGINSSAMAANIPRQIDGAMMRVVVEMLKDPRIVDYLKE